MSTLQEDAKKLLPFVQAMAEGKAVQFSHTGIVWRTKDTAAGWDMTAKYRIKPEPKLRPYTRAEFMEKCLGKRWLRSSARRLFQ